MLSKRPAFLTQRAWIGRARRLLHRARVAKRNFYGFSRPRWWPRRVKWALGPESKFDGKQVTIIAAGEQYDFAPATFGWFRGHVYEGRLLPHSAQIATHFAARGIPQEIAPLFAAVARFEGGFDTIQTYDRAKFSWGFIQFAAIGGLPRLLQAIQCERPELFEKYFRASGLDVEGSTLVVQRRGATWRGWHARNCLHDDPALWKPFLLAAQDPAIQAQQIQVAYENYYVGVLEKFIRVGGRAYSLGEFFAENNYAYAVLFDRAVHRGLAYTPRLFQRAAMISKVQSPRDAPRLLAAARGLEVRHHHRWDQLQQVAQAVELFPDL